MICANSNYFKGAEKKLQIESYHWVASGAKVNNTNELDPDSLKKYEQEAAAVRAGGQKSYCCSS